MNAKGYQNQNSTDPEAPFDKENITHITNET